ncbi:hypothetical protein [Cardinium endosymbiont of Culicoides punctatus]|uniref:hypothetical protein n=1 Tax=Cardinium endosymbiont of Culicoides punctatus TaxID=2304601 RepID=UPI001058FFAB|nr:hypothetical protein [Cardinium endosymbiont of Culicoides punctatus]
MRILSLAATPEQKPQQTQKGTAVPQTKIPLPGERVTPQIKTVTITGPVSEAIPKERQKQTPPAEKSPQMQSKPVTNPPLGEKPPESSKTLEKTTEKAALEAIREACYNCIKGQLSYK